MCELHQYDEEISRTDAFVDYDRRELYCLCKNEPKLALHCFHKDAVNRDKWLKELGLSENQVKSHSRV